MKKQCHIVNSRESTSLLMNYFCHCFDKNSACDIALGESSAKLANNQSL